MFLLHIQTKYFWFLGIQTRNNKLVFHTDLYNPAPRFFCLFEVTFCRLLYVDRSFFIFANYHKSRQQCLLLRWTNASCYKRTLISDIYNFARLCLDLNINASGRSMKMKRKECPYENVVLKDLAPPFFFFPKRKCLVFCLCNKICYCFLEQLQHCVPGGKDMKSGRVCWECAWCCFPKSLSLPSIWAVGRWWFAHAKQLHLELSLQVSSNKI